MNRSAVTSKTRDMAGKAAKFAVASGLAETVLRRGMRVRRKLTRKSRPNIAVRIIRGVLFAGAVAAIAFIGPRLLRRGAQMNEVSLGEMNPRPTA